MVADSVAAMIGDTAAILALLVSLLRTGRGKAILRVLAGTLPVDARVGVSEGGSVRHLAFSKRAIMRAIDAEGIEGILQRRGRELTRVGIPTFHINLRSNLGAEPVHLEELVVRVRPRSDLSVSSGTLIVYAVYAAMAYPPILSASALARPGTSAPIRLLEMIELSGKAAVTLPPLRESQHNRIDLRWDPGESGTFSASFDARCSTPTTVWYQPLMRDVVFWLPDAAGLGGIKDVVVRTELGRVERYAGFDRLPDKLRDELLHDLHPVRPSVPGDRAVLIQGAETPRPS